VRRRRILQRAALRRLLGDLLALRPERVPLGSDGGRPVVELPEGFPAVHVSCSASGPVGLVALSCGDAVGVDVERIAAEDPETAAREGWLTADERVALAQLPAAERRVAVTRCWVQKEAVLKAEGVGLRRSPATVGTPVAETGWVDRWCVVPLPVPTGFVAGLAARFFAPVPGVGVLYPVEGGEG
jgi:4'-phosphopantetheinyl transferase